VLAEITAALAAGERVTLTGFGTFEAVARAERTARNPRTGATVAVAATTVARFHPGTALRDAVAAGDGRADRTAVDLSGIGGAATAAADRRRGASSAGEAQVEQSASAEVGGKPDKPAPDVGGKHGKSADEARGKRGKSADEARGKRGTSADEARGKHGTARAKVEAPSKAHGKVKPAKGDHATTAKADQKAAKKADKKSGKKADKKSDKKADKKAKAKKK
jgi:DNA-binding protein HU-beta